MTKIWPGLGPHRLSVWSPFRHLSAVISHLLLETLPMSKHLERDLDNLQRDILAQAGAVEQAIHRAIRALQERDAQLAQQVIDGDSEIDQEENHVEEECLKILALHQPVAVDLRRIASALLINVDLERMGDLAEDIAERALALTRPPHIPVPAPLQRMTDVTTSM